MPRGLYTMPYFDSLVYRARPRGKGKHADKEMESRVIGVRSSSSSMSMKTSSPPSISTSRHNSIRRKFPSYDLRDKEQDGPSVLVDEHATTAALSTNDTASVAATSHSGATDLAPPPPQILLPRPHQLHPHSSSSSLRHQIMSASSTFGGTSKSAPPSWKLRSVGCMVKAPDVFVLIFGV